MFLLWGLLKIRENPEQNPTFFVCLFPSPFWQKQGISSFISVGSPTTFPHFFGLPKKRCKRTRPNLIAQRTECYVGSLPSSDGADFTDCLSNSEGLPIGAGESCQARVMDFHHGNLRAPPKKPATPPPKK